MSLAKRLYRLFQSVAGDHIEPFEDLLKQGSQTLDEKLSEWEKQYAREETIWKQQKKSCGSDHSNSGQYQKNKSESAYPQRVVDDLQLFGLTPPSNHDEVKKARNKEIKIYHPDHFNSNPEKQETAKKILQIYNSAYERLKLYYANLGK